MIVGHYMGSGHGSGFGCTETSSHMYTGGNGIGVPTHIGNDTSGSGAGYVASGPETGCGYDTPSKNRRHR